MAAVLVSGTAAAISPLFLGTFHDNLRLNVTSPPCLDHKFLLLTVIALYFFFLHLLLTNHFINDGIVLHGSWQAMSLLMTLACVVELVFEHAPASCLLVPSK